MSRSGSLCDCRVVSTRHGVQPQRIDRHVEHCSRHSEHNVRRLEEQVDRLRRPVADPLQRATVGSRSILAEAHAIVDGARRLSYGHPRDNHTRTAALWSAYLGIQLSPRQVCMLNTLQKISRDAHRAGRDNLVDIAGWARNAELCQRPGCGGE